MINFKLINSVLAADNTSVNIGAETSGFFGYTCIGNLVSNIVAAAFMVSGIAFFVFLVWGGVQYLTSGGDKTGTADAQKKITAAFIGLFIVASSWAVYQLVIYFFGINLNSLCTDKPVG
jgi:hypothetical protein